jgi:hypothetical protein
MDTIPRPYPTRQEIVEFLEAVWERSRQQFEESAHDGHEILHVYKIKGYPLWEVIYWHSFDLLDKPHKVRASTLIERNSLTGTLAVCGRDELQDVGERTHE